MLMPDTIIISPWDRLYIAELGLLCLELVSQRLATFMVRAMFSQLQQDPLLMCYVTRLGLYSTRTSSPHLSQSMF